MLILDKPLALERLVARAARARIPEVFALAAPSAPSQLPPVVATLPRAAAPPLPIGAWLWGDYPLPSAAPMRESVGAP